MTPRARYLLGTVLLGVAVVVLLCEVLMMTNIIPSYGLPRSLNLFAIALVIVAARMRRRARAETMTPPPAP